MFHLTIEKQLRNKQMKHPCRILDTQGDDYLDVPSDQLKTIKK
jgi:hypothetical protein